MKYNIGQYILLYALDGGNLEYEIVAGHIHPSSARVIITHETRLKEIPDWNMYYGWMVYRKPYSDEDFEGIERIAVLCIKDVKGSIPITIWCDPKLKQKGWKEVKI